MREWGEGVRGDAEYPYSCKVLKRRWQISLMAPSSLVSCDTSRSSSPTASSSSSTDSKSAPLPCRIPAGTRRRRCTLRRCGDRWHPPCAPTPPLSGRLSRFGGCRLSPQRRRCRDMRRHEGPSYSGQAGAAHRSRKRRARRPSRGTRSGGCQRRTP